MNDEKRIVTENEMEFLKRYNELPKEWQMFLLEFLRMSNEGHETQEIIDTMLSDGRITQEMAERLNEILADQKGA